MVHLEDFLVSLDGNGDGSDVESGEEGAFALGVDVLPLDDIDVGGMRVVVGAVSISTGVGVGLLELSFVISQVVEGGGLVSTAAAVGLRDAIDELLLREGVELSGPDLVSTFEGTSGGEGPAGSTLSLVLDGGDGTIISPVPGASDLNVGERDGGVEARVFTSSESEEFLVFSISVGGELVVCDGKVSV